MRSVEPPHPDLLSIPWFRDGENVICIDGTEHSFDANHVVFFTMLNRVEVKKAGRAALIQFKQTFHCVSQAGAETSCRGGLFFGSTSVPAIAIPSPQVGKFELLFSVFLPELRVGDDNAAGPASGFRAESNGLTHNVLATTPGYAGYSPLWSVRVLNNAHFAAVSNLATATAFMAIPAGATVNCPTVK